VLALRPGHPYLRLPLQFATALERRLLALLDAAELGRLRQDAETARREVLALLRRAPAGDRERVGGRWPAG